TRQYIDGTSRNSVVESRSYKAAVAGSIPAGRTCSTVFRYFRAHPVRRLHILNDGAVMRRFRPPNTLRPRRHETMTGCRPFALFLFLAGTAVAAEDKPLTPIEARKKVGETITVEMTIQSTKDRLEKRGEIYMDAETDFRDAKNFALVITKAGAASL